MNPSFSSPPPPPCLVLACSGSSDVGEIADRAARKLERLGIARMHCLAEIGGQVTTTEEATKDAALVVVLDGCSKACGGKTLEHAGLKNFIHIDLTEFGMERGNAPASEMLVNRVVDRVAILLRERAAEATV